MDHPPNIPSSRGKGKQLQQESVGIKAPYSRLRMICGKMNEALVKEEGVLSDTEEVYEPFKEVKWMEWCSNVLTKQKKTLERLQRLQSISANLPKEKVHHSTYFTTFSRFPDTTSL
ncbi:SNF2-related, N-terminal domain-containing protein [Artemisia annua]|uniref:SNF2-related, N-terminal domain-containing protein n=1 Tax=Artemisia annua TaxID=35608 RepID=A0A2U1KFR5_ARTAN|nr:SNF2-related, N-terminal domain-containing protein [Artemisia annua]PWA59483.1 SNF2-related, N-terminal domain-containing protein [Artemisia annua]